MDADFLAAVTAWARGYYRDAGIVVTEVTSLGTDWDGDSENGFYSSFRVSLIGTKGNGRGLFADVEGEAMESLWKFVIAGFRLPESGT